MHRAERAGQIGQGVEVQAIRRDRDIYLDGRISTESSQLSYWNNRENLIHQIENIQNALGENNLRNRLDRFWSGWQELAKNATEPSVRNSLVEDAVSLTQGFNDQFRKLNRLRIEINEKVIAKVNDINDINQSLAEINTRILKSQAAGDNPNDLLDHRDQLIGQLSELIDVQINHRDSDEIMVFSGGKVLVQGTEYSPLEYRADEENEGLVQVYFKQSGDVFELRSGSLKSDLEVRDVLLRDQIRRLDSLATNVMFAVNEIHRQGFDLYGKKTGDFFNVIYQGTDPLGGYDTTGDGVNNQSYWYQLSGNQQLSSHKALGESGVLTFRDKNGDFINIEYNQDEKVQDILEKINGSDIGVNAYLNNEGYLVFKARSDNPQSFAINHLQDSGRFLTGVAGVLNENGVVGAYSIEDVNAIERLKTGAVNAERTPYIHPSSWISINPQVLQDGNKVAAAAGTQYGTDVNSSVSLGKGNGDIAEAIGKIRFSKVVIDDKQTIDDYYLSMISEVAVRGKTASFETSKYKAIVNDLEQVYQSISGVNIDEEMTNMLAMQHGYQAGAKVINAMDQLLDTVINRMGV